MTRPNPFSHLVVRASAGSGKTYRLSARYLTLLLEGAPVDSILATTFTRKAAGEIQDRVLARLGEAASSPEKAAKASNELYGDPRAVSRDRFLRLAVDVVRSLNRLRVCTLDAFFMRIAGGFAFEIGLPPGWRIVDDVDDARLLRGAIQAAFAQSQTKNAVQLTRLLFKGEARRSVAEQLSQLVDDSLKYYYQTTPDAWTKLDFGWRSPSADEFAALVAGLEGAPLPQTKAGKPNSNYVKARAKLVGLVKDENWGAFVKETLTQAVATGSRTFARAEVDDALAKPIESLLEIAKQKTLADVSNQTRATWIALDAISSFFQRSKRESSAFRFDDLSRLLASLQWGDRFKQIVYRLDAKTSHLLLDEFQDASFEQWSILKPFAESIVSRGAGKAAVGAAKGNDAKLETSNSEKTPLFDELDLSNDAAPGDPEPSDKPSDAPGAERGSFFCVGDVKQAIYGWRGGVAEIFNAIEEAIPNVETAEMTCNWRSCPTVIETVNRLFLPLAKNEIFQIDPELDPDSPQFRKKRAFAKAVENWSRRFSKHETAPPNASKLGYCALEVAPLVDAESGLIPDFFAPPVDATGRDDAPDEDGRSFAATSDDSAFSDATERVFDARLGESNSNERRNGADGGNGFGNRTEIGADGGFDLDAANDALECFAGETDEDFDADGGSSGGAFGGGGAKLGEITQKQATLAYAVARVVQLRRQFPNATIGVLTRTNKLIVKFISALKKRGIDASEEGGAPPTDSPAVVAILSVLAVGTHPGDAVAKFHLANVAPLAAYFRLTPENYSDVATGRRVSARIRERVETVGLGRFVAELAELLKPIGDARDRERLDKVVESAFRYETSEETVRLERFAQTVRETKIESPSDSTLRVMSLHKSKGLEFDIVVLPELDAPLDRFREAFVARRSSPTAPVDAVLRSMPQDAQAFLPKEFQKVFEDAWRAQMEEALCLLYVGVTRPVRSLIAITSPNKRGSYKSPTFGNALRAGLAPNAAVFPEGSPNFGKAQIVFELGVKDWAKNDPPPRSASSNVDAEAEDAEKAARRRFAPITVPPVGVGGVDSVDGSADLSDLNGFAADVSAASVEQSGLVESVESIGADVAVAAPKFASNRRLLFHRETPTGGRTSRRWSRATSFALGSALHACFETVRWLDEDGEPTDAALRARLAPLTQNPADVRRAIERFREIGATPFVRRLLSRSTYSACDRLDGDGPGGGSASDSGAISRSAVSLAALKAAGIAVAEPRWEVFRERPFSFLKEGGALWRGTIDRLVVLRDGDRVVAADVVDFKSDRFARGGDGGGSSAATGPSPETLDEYRRQLAAYGKVVANWYSLAPERVSLRLAFVAEGIEIDARREPATAGASAPEGGAR